MVDASTIGAIQALYGVGANGGIPTSLVTDKTLTLENRAADAKTTGNAVQKIANDVGVLKEDIVGQKGKLTAIDGSFTPTFEVGVYVVLDGKLTKANSDIQNKRVRTTNPIDFEAGDIITLDDFTNKKISLFFKAENDKYTQSADIVSEYTIPTAYSNAYLQVRYIDESLAPSPAIIDELATLVVRKKDNVIAEIKEQLKEQLVEENKKIDKRTISEHGIFEPFDSTVLDGYAYTSNGKVLEKEDDAYHLHLKLPVSENEKYRANFRIGKGDILAIVFADEKLNYVNSGWSNPDTATNFVNYEIVIPNGVKYLFVTSLKSVSPTIEKFRRYTIQEEFSMKESFRENEAKAVFSIMTYNVGDWYEGAWRSEDKTGIIPADESIYQKYMAVHESILRRYSCDFVCFNEYSDEMCMSRHIQADEFVGQFYPYIEKGVMIESDGVWNAIASKRKLNNVTTGFYQNTESGITRSYTKGYMFLNGRKVCIICTHFSSTPETAALNAQEMLEVVTNEDYFILCGDFNCDVFRKTSEVLYKNIVGVFANAGYKLCNGGEKGDFLTLGDTELSSGADIIVTSSNIVIKSVLADQQKVEASIAVNHENGFINRIDHVPLIAYLEIF